MIVLFIHGPVAVGKYTIGARLSESLNLPLFHNHLTVDLVNTLFEFGSPSFIGLRADIWRASFTEAAMNDRSFIFTFNPESTVDPDLIGELVKIVESRGGKIHFIELTCSPDTVLHRLVSDSRHRFGKLTDVSVYKELQGAGSFEFPALPEPLIVIDTQALNEKEAAIQIELALSGVI